MGIVAEHRARAESSDPRGKGPVLFLGISATVTGLLVVSAWSADTQLGAPGYWSWVLTGLQVLSLWAAGGKKWWAWALGAAVQPPWIAYALLTGQIGFIPGCLISAAVQTHSFMRARTKASPLTRFRFESAPVSSRA